MNYWLVKSEPNVYSWAQLVADGQTCWNGIRNYAARLNLRAFKNGDQVFFYHSNIGLAIVGIAKVVKEAYPDPDDETNTWTAVDIMAVKELKTPVSLEAVKATPELKNMALVRLGRLSVQPVTVEEFKCIMQLANKKAI